MAGPKLWNLFFSRTRVIARDASSGRYVIDLVGMPGAVAALAKELLEEEATGDRDESKRGLQKYGSVPPELAKALGAASDVPVDIDPFFSFPNLCVRISIRLREEGKSTWQMRNRKALKITPAGADIVTGMLVLF